MEYFFYIIYSGQLDRYYTGHTENLDRRLKQHNNGESVFTSATNDWKLVFSESFLTRDDARKRETEIKKKKSRKYIEWMISQTK